MSACIANPSALGASGTPVRGAAPRHPTAYVLDDENVSAVDTVTGDTVATMGLDNWGNSVAVSPDGNRAYITQERPRGSSTGDNIAVIDTATNTVTDTFSFGQRPTDIVIAPDGDHAYVADIGSRSVTVMDLATHTQSASVPLDGPPTAAAVSRSGNEVYAAESNGDMQAIDTATHSVTGTVPGAGSGPGGHTRDVAVSPDGSLAYVTQNKDAGISVIDTATHTKTATIPTGSLPYAVTVSPDGEHAYAANVNADTVSVIDTATNKVTDTVPVGDGPNSLALTPDGRDLYVTNYRDCSLSVIDTTTHEATTRRTGGAPVAVAIAGAPTAPATADLEVNLNATPVRGLSGRIDYTVTVTNHGPGAASKGTVTTTLPGKAKPNGPGCDTATGSVTCSVTDLAPGASTTRSFSIPASRLDLGATTKATATLGTSDPADPNADNNTATRTCTVTTPLLVRCR
ncbi:MULTISPECIES: beta-propeller fold lactonase family protein [unclassified Streptomyces]|uniref:beta-propeller fold lactonase family protein n=1 Tax=unclassified Streptomyces TaxID=2593676 RepID=UPI002E1882B3|nr:MULTISPECIES: beta-propeller fold lactonase family protein [unclassified Streptomyces]